MDWAAQGHALAGCLPLERLHAAVVAELGRCTRRVGVACSGGADSVCLLLLLHAHMPALHSRLMVLHFDHRLRGGESAGDAAFVRELAAGLDLPFYEAAWDTPPDDPDEDATRRARHAFLRTALRCDGLLCFGHNADDVAESLLLRLGRGSGLDGLAGPRPVQRFEQHRGLLHLRPLLHIGGAEIRDALRATGTPWREDTSNATPRYTRNRLRHEVLPLLGDILGRDWVAGAGRSRSRVDEADALVCEHAHLLLGGVGEPLAVAPLRNAQRAVARRALELWLARQDLRHCLASGPFEALLDAICHARPAHVPCGAGVLELTHDALEWRCAAEATAAPWAAVALPPCGELHLPGGAVLRTEVMNGRTDLTALAADPAARAHTLACLRLPPGTILTVRPWREGDAYRPLGAPGTQRLSDQFINRKVPRAERARLPVVCVGTAPVWCPRLPPSDEYRLTNETQSAVRLTYLHS